MSGKDTILQRIAGACEGKDIAKVSKIECVSGILYIVYNSIYLSFSHLK